MTYDEVVDYILNIPKFAKDGSGRGKSGNDNLRYVMTLLDNPCTKIKAIHIAGTNGKGSTTTHIKNILCELGYRVGVFTSPHLIKINERIAVADKKTLLENISDKDFVNCFYVVDKAVKQAVKNGHAHLSFFEFIFAMAAVYFETQSLDFVIYETGLGGRLDATNIVMPCVTAITSIGLDHVMYLGDTIEKIAYEKAGIIKPGVPVIYNTGKEAADSVIENQARLVDSKAINVAKTDYIINGLLDKNIDFSICNSYYKYDHLVIGGTTAIYQVDNAATAIAVCNEMYYRDNNRYIPYEMIKNAMAKFFWSGRMEQIHENVVLDGAHNDNAMVRFTESVNKSYAKQKKYLLFAVAEDKDYKDMISTLVHEVVFDGIFVTKIDSERGVSSKFVADIFINTLQDKKNGNFCRNTKVVNYDNIDTAFKMGFETAVKNNGVLFCVGSLYLVGSIKAAVEKAF